MIDDILKNLRANFQRAPIHQMYSYFQDLLVYVNNLNPNVTLPEIKIVYSLNKTCETFKYKNVTYIIHDQYLGQTFNKLNRLIYYESDGEAKAYLCKLLSEEYYLINEVSYCISYQIYYQVNSKAVAGDLPIDFLVKKGELCALQESFVLMHELAHTLIPQIDLTTKTKLFLETNEGAILLMKTFNEVANDKFEFDFSHFLEEFSCDIFALEYTFKYFSEKFKINEKLIFEALPLAFLYMRTVIDVRKIARGEYQTSSDIFSFFTKLRYNLMRNYFYTDNFSDKLYVTKPDLIQLYENWESKIDTNIVLFLNEELKLKLQKIISGKKELINLEMAEKFLNIRE